MHQGLIARASTIRVPSATKTPVGEPAVSAPGNTLHLREQEIALERQRSASFDFVFWPVETTAPAPNVCCHRQTKIRSQSLLLVTGSLNARYIGSRHHTRA